MSGPRTAANADRDAASVFPRLPDAQRTLAQYVVDCTSLLVREAASGKWDHIPAIVAARNVLLQQLQSENCDADQQSCLDALFAAVIESEQTLSLIASQTSHSPRDKEGRNGHV